ncbi:MAG: hypothetical protein ACFCU1_04290 [Sumerlaeia bacterium]
MKTIYVALGVCSSLIFSSSLNASTEAAPQLGILARSKAPFTVVRSEQPIVVPQNTEFNIRRGDQINTTALPVQLVDQTGTTIAINKDSSLRFPAESSYEVISGQIAVVYNAENPATVLFNNLKISPQAAATGTELTIKPISETNSGQPIMLVDAINQGEVQIFGFGETLLIAADNLEQRLATIPSGDYLRLAKNATTGAWETVSDIPEFLSAASTNNTQRIVEVVDDRRLGLFWLNSGVAAGAGAATLVGGTILLLNDDDDDPKDDDDKRDFSSPFFPRP